MPYKAFRLFSNTWQRSVPDYPNLLRQFAMADLYDLVGHLLGAHVVEGTRNYLSIASEKATAKPVNDIATHLERTLEKILKLHRPPELDGLNLLLSQSRKRNVEIKLDKAIECIRADVPLLKDDSPENNAKIKFILSEIAKMEFWTKNAIARRPSGFVTRDLSKNFKAMAIAFCESNTWCSHVLRWVSSDYQKILFAMIVTVSVLKFDNTLTRCAIMVAKAILRYALWSAICNFRNTHTNNMVLLGRRNYVRQELNLNQEQLIKLWCSSTVSSQKVLKQPEEAFTVVKLQKPKAPSDVAISPLSMSGLKIAGGFIAVGLLNVIYRRLFFGTLTPESDIILDQVLPYSSTLESTVLTPVVRKFGASKPAEIELEFDEQPDPVQQKLNNSVSIWNSIKEAGDDHLKFSGKVIIDSGEYPLSFSMQKPQTFEGLIGCLKKAQENLGKFWEKRQLKFETSDLTYTDLFEKTNVDDIVYSFFLEHSKSWTVFHNADIERVLRTFHARITAVVHNSALDTLMQTLWPYNLQVRVKDWHADVKATQEQIVQAVQSRQSGDEETTDIEVKRDDAATIAIKAQFDKLKKEADTKINNAKETADTATKRAAEAERKLAAANAANDTAANKLSEAQSAKEAAEAAATSKQQELDAYKAQNNPFDSDSGTTPASISSMVDELNRELSNLRQKKKKAEDATTQTEKDYDESQKTLKESIKAKNKAESAQKMAERKLRNAKAESKRKTRELTETLIMVQDRDVQTPLISHRDTEEREMNYKKQKGYYTNAELKEQREQYGGKTLAEIKTERGRYWAEAFLTSFGDARSAFFKGFGLSEK